MTPRDKYYSQVDFEGARLEVIPLFDSAVPGFVNKVPVLFQFVTGRDPTPSREPFALTVVLDVSGSMMGDRLKTCKKAICQLFDAADDEDRLSLVAYSSAASVIFENVRCGDKGARQLMKDKLQSLRADGGTNLYGGLLTGYNLLRNNAEATNKHLFLLSDGQVTMGEVRGTDEILAAVAEWQESIPILSYGIGESFNEKLMSPLGQIHRGSHYFYLTNAGSIERWIAKGINALTGAVARNVRLRVMPLTDGICFPDHMIDGAFFPLVRERSVVQLLVELELRPALRESMVPQDGDFELVSAVSSQTATQTALRFAWEVDGFPLLSQSSGHAQFRVTTDRGFRAHESQEVRTYLDVKRGCDLRRGAAGSSTALADCKQALRLFEGRLHQDRFGFADEWAAKTKALLEDSSLWMTDGRASTGAAKHLGVAHARVEEEEEEVDMDFDLFG